MTASIPLEHRATEDLAADEAGLSRAAAILRAGGLVAFPTETVYGLGADATDGRRWPASTRPRSRRASIP